MTNLTADGSMPALVDATESDPLWTAVLARDARQDGRFVYAVASTGVYCRPSCPSRRPRRDRVTFFDRPDLAERAGFRACLRCRPKSTAPAVDVVTRACAWLDARIAEPLEQAITLAALARAVGRSPFHLQRVFKRATGVSPREYVAARRLGRFKSALGAGESVTAATYDAGFGSASRVYAQADAALGMTPATYGRGGAGMHIRYTVVACELGRVLVAGTARGLSAVSLGADEATLVAALRREYPKATLEPAAGDLRRWVAAVVALADGRATRVAELPVDVQATAFERRVWQELQRIPAGDVRSYRDVAAAIGRPSAVRAVAQACAHNRLALVVPCHRVVRHDGGLGGYRWGVRRKERLLARERAKPAR